jgi:isocitrate/isopropylmalate dehydrogenase
MFIYAFKILKSVCYYVFLVKFAGVVESYKIVTKEKSRRIAKFAFDYAVKHGRKKVTAVHKANIMKLGDGLFLRCCEEVSDLSYTWQQYHGMTHNKKRSIFMGL